METAFVFNFRRSGLFFQTIYATLWKQKRIRYEMNFKEEIPLGSFLFFVARKEIKRLHSRHLISPERTTRKSKARSADAAKAA